MLVPSAPAAGNVIEVTSQAPFAVGWATASTDAPAGATNPFNGSCIRKSLPDWVTCAARSATETDPKLSSDSISFRPDRNPSASAGVWARAAVQVIAAPSQRAMNGG